ncbi:MAG: DUF1622 domain-containing protein [Phycisphaerae bacterium]
MPDKYIPIVEWVVWSLEAMGVAAVVTGAVWAVIRAVVELIGRVEHRMIFRNLRRALGRGILVGLEFLVAADIIHTVVVRLEWDTVGVLAVIVLIRTFLSFTLEVEITGNWPWQNRRENQQNL